MSSAAALRIVARQAAFTIAVLILLSMLASTGQAQVLYGLIVGNVTDPSGAAVAGAEVRLTNTGTSQTDQVTTNDAGLFTFQSVIAGTYDLAVIARGFSVSKEQGIPVNANTLQRRDVTLQLGALAETVSVEASAVTLQTDSAAVSSEITTKELTNIPMGQYRNYQSMELLVPGATPPRFQSARTDTPQRTLTVNMNGTDRQSNTTKIDGTVSMNIALPSHNAYIPGADTIEAVNIVTDAFDAEQGGTGGAAITVTTKSGTNAIHGSLYENLENSILGARDFFNPGKVTPKEILNIGGVTIAGPIKKDKLFYFFGYETNRERADVGTTQTLPTADQRAGNFSAYTGTVIYDPTTGSSNGTGRTVFPNNIIPTNRLDPIALKLQGYLPATDLSGTAQNYYSSGDDVENRDQYDLKINYNANEKLRTFFKYGIMRALTEGKGSLGNGGPPGGGCNCSGGAGQGDTQVQTATVGQTYIFSPTLVYDGAEGFTRMSLRSYPELYGTNFGSQVLGIRGANPTSPGGDSPNWGTGMPTFTVSGYATMGDRDAWNPVFRKDQTPTISQNLSWTKGKHDVRMGFDGLEFRMNFAQTGSGGPKGTINWTGAVTQLNGGPAPTQYNSWASFLLGLPASYQVGSQWENYIAYEYQFGLYVRDRWAVNHKLTVSYGLRWEKYPLFTRAGGRPGIEEYNPVSNVMTLGGAGGNSNSLGVTTSNKLFAPRLGIAYRFNDKTVIRTGYGISIDPASLGRQLLSYPLTVGNTFVGANSYLSYGPLAQGMPTVLGPPPGTGSIVVPTSAAIEYISPSALKRGYIQSWNFIVERQLPAKVFFSVGYVATNSVDERYAGQINAAQPGTGNPGLPLFQAFGRTNSTLILQGGLSSNYNSLQSTWQRRVAGGLTLKGAFTWSKALGMIDDGGGTLFFQLPSIRARNYALEAFDQPFVFSNAFVYDLPFGAGRPFLNSGIASKIFGRWQWNGLLTAFSGRPFTVQSSATSLNAPNTGTQTGNQVCAKPQFIGSVAAWYNPSCFAPVTTAAFGNTNRNILRGPGVINLDTSLFRQFKVTERLQGEFRFEGFNIANTAHFNPPNDAAPNGNPFSLVTGSDFMRITTTLGPPGQGKDAPARYFRLGLRFSW